ncbi:uncharacterized protein LOC119268018 [Triticum dicoccoides]|nr:uncharacterized protein LOC119268018 [Triticum dicoccoides]
MPLVVQFSSLPMRGQAVVPGSVAGRVWAGGGAQIPVLHRGRVWAAPDHSRLPCTTPPRADLVGSIDPRLRRPRPGTPDARIQCPSPAAAPAPSHDPRELLIVDSPPWSSVAVPCRHHCYSDARLPPWKRKEELHPSLCAVRPASPCSRMVRSCSAAHACVRSTSAGGGRPWLSVAP